MNLELLNYRQRVFSHYAEVRDSRLPAQERAARFREARDRLFARHPQSALSDEQKAQFQGLDYYTYDAKWRLEADLDFSVEQKLFEIELKDDGILGMRRLARAKFLVAGRAQEISIYWLMGYGGGLFLPFRDLSRESGETYGGSRYLLDTIKGADLGNANGHLLLDFNYAYNPSCAYIPHWDCPLAPQENWLEISIPAGEKSFSQI